MKGPVLERLTLFLFGFLLRRVKYDIGRLERVSNLLETGVVVHIFQLYSILEALTLKAYMRSVGLPEPTIVVHPFWKRVYYYLKGLLYLFTFRRFDPPLPPMPNTTAAGGHYIIFLKRRPALFEPGSKPLEHTQIRDLLLRQQGQETPIFLVPEIIIWNKFPLKAGTGSIVDYVLGNNLYPGKLRKLLIFLRNIRSAFAVTGEPINLKERIDKNQDAAPADLAQEIRMEIFKFFAEERVATAGPIARPRAYVLESIINSSEVREVILRKANEEKRPVEEVKAEAARILDKIASDMSPTYLKFFDAALNYAFKRLFGDIFIMDKEIASLRELLKSGPVVFVPSHKSHIDYLLWSWIMYNYNIYPPLIVAGDNLDFFPIGHIFRKSGALFIRRTFRGDWFYATILKAYIKKMFWEGYSQEFFIEGGRSRTGKLLMPKLGILSTYVETFLENPDRDLRIVPIAITYERLIEEKAYKRELEGADKRKESLRSLLGIRKVLKSRYGNVYVRLGKTISFREFFANRGLDPEQGVSGAEFRKLVRDLAFQIIANINAVTTVTPQAVVATALLAHTKRGITHDELKRKFDKLLTYLRSIGAYISPVLDSPNFTITGTIELLERERLIKAENFENETIYTVVDEERLRLGFYRNTILHFFVPLCIGATALLSFKSDRVKSAVLKERGKELSRLFRFEFVFNPDRPFDEVYEETLQFLIKENFVELDGEFVVVREDGEEGLRSLAAMIMPFIESYWLCSKSLNLLLDRPMPEKEFVKHALKTARRAHLLGEARFSESQNKVNISNAVQYFVYRGVLLRETMFESTNVEKLPPEFFADERKRRKVEKKSIVYLSLYEEYRTPERLNLLVGEIERFLAPL